MKTKPQQRKYRVKEKKKLLPWRVHSNHKLFKFIIHGEMRGPTIHLEMKLRVNNRELDIEEREYIYIREISE